MFDKTKIAKRSLVMFLCPERHWFGIWLGGNWPDRMFWKKVN